MVLAGVAALSQTNGTLVMESLWLVLGDKPRVPQLMPGLLWDLVGVL